MLQSPERSAWGPAVRARSSHQRAISSRAEAARAEALSDQAIALVHLIASSLRVRRSLGTAVRFAAANLKGAAGEELERLEWEVRIRRFSTVEEGLMALAARLGSTNPELKRALLTLQGAETEPTRQGLERRLDRAYDIVLRAEERRRERISSTLERPVTTLFGIGVVLPLVVASLIPMLQMAAPALSAAPIALLMLVVLPVAMFLGASRIAERNQLGADIERADRRVALACSLLPAMAGMFLWGAGTLVTWSVPIPLTALVAAAVALCGAGSGIDLHRHSVDREREQGALDADLPDFLHAIGSKMAAGRAAEQALLEAVEASTKSPLASRLRGVLFDVMVGRRSLEQAIEADEAVRSAARVYPAMRLMALAAARDAASSGQVVLHLAEFERLRHDAAESTRTRVRSIVETSRTTVVVFAPLILGITAGMFSLLARVSVMTLTGASGGSSSMTADAFGAMVAVYLAIQVALADWFAARMLSTTPASTFGAHLARDVPLALGLFAASQVAASAIF
jgi:hypothetical protein